MSKEGHGHTEYASTTELESLKTSVSNGKSLIASAITDKGVSTASDATFQTMANNIGSIAGLGSPYHEVINGNAGDSTYNYQFSCDDMIEWSSMNTSGTSIGGSSGWGSCTKWVCVVSCRYKTSSSGTYQLFTFIVTNETVKWGEWFTDAGGYVSFCISHTGLPIPTGNDTCLYILGKLTKSIYGLPAVGYAFSGVV